MERATARAVIGLVVMILFMPDPHVAALDTADTRATLRGLLGVYVAVEALQPEAEFNGLTKTQLQTDVELRLSQAGIRVLGRDEMFATPGRPFLYVRVTTYLDPVGLYAFNTSVGLYQHAMLQRNVSMQLGAQTWSVGETGTVGAAMLHTIRDVIRNHVDTFINAYLAVNPGVSHSSAHDTHQAPVSLRTHIHQTQIALQAAGFDPGPIDGVLGPRTRDALRWFQNAYGLPITGKPDEATRQALGVQ